MPPNEQSEAGAKGHSVTSYEALRVLREKYEKIDPDFPFDLVKRCYEIERRYQYERERDVPINEIRAQVTVAVEHSISEDESSAT